MFALGLFNDLQQFLAPYVGGALLSFFLSLAGVILLFGIVGLLAFLAVFYFVFRSEGAEATSDSQAKRDTVRTRILERPVANGVRSQFFDGFRAPLDGLR